MVSILDSGGLHTFCLQPGYVPCMCRAMLCSVFDTFTAVQSAEHYKLTSTLLKSANTP